MIQDAPLSSSRLMEAFSFSAQDLAANRAGAVSERQRELLDQTARMGSCAGRVALLIFFGLAALLAVVPLLASADPSMDQARPFLLLTALGVACVASTFVVIGVRRAGALRHHELRVAEGVAACSSRRINHGRYMAYYLTLGSVRLQLQSQAQQEALRQGSLYRVYYAHYPPAHIIMSIEESR
jgi:hypothetical protein